MLHGSVWAVLVPRFAHFGKGFAWFRRPDGAVGRFADALLRRRTLL
jgi:hypothetical protein